MVVKRFWPATKLGWSNLLLALVALIMLLLWRQELHWAWEQIPDYRRNIIDSPLERQLYVGGKHVMYKQQQAAEAIAMLDQSIAIDPNTEALFLRAEALRLMGDLDRAVREYERYLDIDDRHITARWTLIKIYQHQNKIELARSTAEEGVRVFGGMVKYYRPQTDPSVEDKYNQKAIQVYQRYRKALEGFRELAREEG